MSDEALEAIRREFRLAWRTFYRETIKPFEQRCYPFFVIDELHQKAWKSFRRFLTIRLYGGMCQCCGESTDRLLTLDHIRRNGKRPKGGWTDAYFAKGSGKFQVLCVGCNHAKAREGDVECPHQSIRRISAELSNSHHL